MRLAIIVATYGRSPTVQETWTHWMEQTRPADRVFVSAVSPADVPECVRADPRVEVLYGSPGSCSQRNRAMDIAEQDCDVAVFFDDDFVPAPTYLAEVEHIFMTRLDAVLLTGRVLADGVTLGGYDYRQACAFLAAGSDEAADPPAPAPARSAYGCNMAARLIPARIRFDEKLPLYGWLEDVDFSYCMGAHGAVLQCPSLLGVHMGVTRARSPGQRTGYSQIVNPYYFWRKGTFTVADLTRKPVQNFMANMLKSLAPEPWMDRRGRLVGNLRGMWDILRGRARPDRILEF
jgi:GT2 family glycosyltransferase